MPTYSKTLVNGVLAVRCPLCFDHMAHRYVGEKGAHIFVYACDRDKIAIRVDDPQVGKWYGHRVPCANETCGRPMRVFTTSIGFMKAICRSGKKGKKGKGCGAEMRVEEPDKTKAERAAVYKKNPDGTPANPQGTPLMVDDPKGPLFH